LDTLSVAALAVFAGTLFLMIRRPRGLRLGYAAGIGAVVSLLLGTVTMGQAAASFLDIWDAALAFLGIVALSVVLDAMGFFKWAALRVVKLARGSGLKLYFYVTFLTVVVSILFANDSAVLILIPIVLEIINCLNIDAKGRLAYLFSAGLIADTAAMPLITSNPINILSADFFGYTFLDHLKFMAPIAVATITSSILIVYLFFRHSIPKVSNPAAADVLTGGKQVVSPVLLRICFGTLVAVDVGYVLTSLGRFPVSLVICSGAVFLGAVYGFMLRYTGSVNGSRKGLLQLVRDINWDILLFMFSIFIVVQGLETAGITNLLAQALQTTSQLPSVLGVFVPSMVVTVGASFLNNWSMTILGMLSIHHLGASGTQLTRLIFSNLIGNNLGPHFFPLGSLAILMWLETMRRKGVNISLKEYLKVGAVLSIVEVGVASVVLWFELSAGFTLTL
jgi:arsenical pump membrane protein